MNPCELNALITSIANSLYTSLPRDQFLCLSVFLNELSKQMLTMPIFNDLCNREGRFHPDLPLERPAPPPGKPPKIP